MSRSPVRIRSVAPKILRIYGFKRKFVGFFLIQPFQLSQNRNIAHETRQNKTPRNTISRGVLRIFMLSFGQAPWVYNVGLSMMCFCAVLCSNLTVPQNDSFIFLFISLCNTSIVILHGFMDQSMKFYWKFFIAVVKYFYVSVMLFLCLFKCLFVAFGIAKQDARISVGGFYSTHSCGQWCMDQ